MMSGPKDIPIKSKATGKVSHGWSASSQKPKKTNPLTGKDIQELPSRLIDEETKDLKIKMDNADESVSDSTDWQQNKKQKSKKTPKLDIRSLAHFIEYAYSRKGQRIFGTFEKAEKAIYQNYVIHTEEMVQLLERATDDNLLAVPKELLLISRSIVGYPRVKNEIRSFVEQALKKHFLFAENELALVLNNHPEAISPEEALDKLAKARLPAPEEPLEGNSRKPVDQEVLRSNAVYCLAIWFVESRAFSIEKIIQMLNVALWKPSVSESADDTAKLKALTEIRDIEGVGLVCSILKKEADKYAAMAEAAFRSQESLAEQVQNLRLEIENLQSQQQESLAKIHNLTNALESEKNSHAHSRVHLGDDKEQLRARLLRRLKTEANLLEEGLHALRRDPPKIHVMDDHAERALDGLYKEIRELESED